MADRTSRPELDAVRARLFGGVPEDRIAAPGVPRVDPAVVARLRALGDLSCTIADALDQIGCGSVLPAFPLAVPRDTQRVCGPAITMRCAPYGGDQFAHRSRGADYLYGDRDLFGTARPGDVAVITVSGEMTAAVMGETSAAWARLAGVAGVLVDGNVRDVEALRAQDLLIWARGATPASARYRLETIEINATIAFAGIVVHPGDLIAVDANGAVVVPASRVEEVLELCERLARSQVTLNHALSGATSLEQLVREFNRPDESTPICMKR